MGKIPGVVTNCMQLLLAQVLVLMWESAILAMAPVTFFAELLYSVWSGKTHSFERILRVYLTASVGAV